VPFVAVGDKLWVREATGHAFTGEVAPGCPAECRLVYRAKELAMRDDEFVCHKTGVEDDEGGIVGTDKSMHCAGFLIFREKIEKPSQMMRICERIGVYDARKFVDSPHAAEVIDRWQELCE